MESLSTMSQLGQFETPEVQFAKALKDYRLKEQKNTFELIGTLKSLSASRALGIGQQLAEDEFNDDILGEFSAWDLETRLWHLVEILYSFRLAGPEPPLKEHGFSSSAVKLENFVRRNPKIREISLIIYWLQVNSRSVGGADLGEDGISGKWVNTKLSIQQKDLDSLIKKEPFKLIDNLDVDAPLRSGKPVHEEDRKVDHKNFRMIYQLVLANKMQEAIDFANCSGNFSLALILIGAIQDYVDPIIDRELVKGGSGDIDMSDANIDEHSLEKPSGIKHKLLWKKAVYKLSQQRDIDYYERLIYSYLSGGDIASNLKESSKSWEECLLIYLNQLYLYKLETSAIANLPTVSLNEETLAIPVPAPQHSDVDGVLNTLLKCSRKVADQSTNPLRIVTGSVMIDQVSILLHDYLKSLAPDKILSDSLERDSLIRIMVHLSIIELNTNSPSMASSKDITKIITYYVSTFKDELSDYVPIYLSFIPDEKDARECYSLFLSSIYSPEQRSIQLQVSRSLAAIDKNFLGEQHTASGDDKMINILRRTVERVLSETEAYYTPPTSIVVKDDTSKVDEVDYRLYRTVEWFFDDKLHEDAIIASVVITRRFLLCGKLSALKQFGKGKSFKQLIKDHDSENDLKNIENDFSSNIELETMKEELLHYENFIQGLNLIDDWKQFLKDNKINGASSNTTSKSFWKSKHIHNSIEKVTITLTKLLFQWLLDLISQTSPSTKLYLELRSIYIPYIVMELLQIYQYSRLNNWLYMRKALNLVNQIADEDDNDLLECFTKSGRLEEFLVRYGQLSVVASEKGLKGIFV